MQPTSRWLSALSVVALAASGGAIVALLQEQQAAPSVDPVVGVMGHWRLGSFETAVDATVGAAGAEVVVADGDLAGLRITVPEFAVPDGTRLTIAHAPILDHTWGAAVDPVTPAIKVELGDRVVADRILTVSVPVDLRPGHLAMGLFVHEGGELEGMAMLGSDGSSIDVATMHFSNWFISAFDPNTLPDAIFTGYQMARDNWQFVNRGSMVSPSGICAGMSVSSMWYFLERYQKAGDPGLYRRFDYPYGVATPGFDWDDSGAIRFASMVQNDIKWGSDAWTFYRSARYAGRDSWHFQAFRYAMYLTGEPQYATLGVSPESSSGHAVIAYGVTVGTITALDGRTHRGGDVWIADPNHPISLNSLRFDAETGRFHPYTGRLSLNNPVTEFAHIGYAAKSALVDWSLVGQRYEEMLAGTVGDGVFPSIKVYQWVVEPTTKSGSWDPASTPVPDAAGQVKLAFSLSEQLVGGTVTVYVLDDGGTRSIAVGRAVAASTHGDLRAIQPVTLRPGIGGRTYKLVVVVDWGRSGGSLVAQASGRQRFVEALPLVIAPVAVTTTVPETVPPTVPETVAPTVPETVPETVPPTAPPPSFDCSSCPPGLAGLECRISCESIGG